MNKEVFDELFYKGQVSQNPTELTMLVNLIGHIIPWLKSVIEIGVYRGGTLRFWRNIVGKDGKVIGIDDDSRGFIDDVKAEYEDDEAVNIIVGDSTSKEVIDKVKGYLNHSMAGMLFIDGCHKYDKARADYDRYKGYVKPGGLIVFHGLLAPEIKIVWDEIVAENNYAGIYELYGRNRKQVVGVIVTD